MPNRKEHIFENEIEKNIVIRVILTKFSLILPNKVMLGINYTECVDVVLMNISKTKEKMTQNIKKKMKNTKKNIKNLEENERKIRLDMKKREKK